MSNTPPPPPRPPLPAYPDDPEPDQAVAELARVTRWLTTVDLERLGDRDLLGLIEGLGQVIDRLALTVALAAGRADTRDATVTVDGLLTDAWLRQALRRTGADRTTLLAVGRVLPTLPHLHNAALAGEVSWSELRPICLAVVKLSADDRRQVDLQLAADPDALRAMAPAEVLELLDQVLTELHPADLEAKERADFSSQWVAFRPRLDGTGQIHGDLDSIAFTDIAGRVGSLADRLPDDPDRPGQPRWRTSGHRQALALHQLVTADSDRRPGTSAKVLVTVEDSGDQEPRVTLHHRRGRRAMSPAQLLRLAALAELRTIVTTGGVPLKVGRTRRFATPAQRDAAWTLWGGCAWPGCDAPPIACQLHHVIDWDARGPTNDDNLVPLCPTHHHAITHGHWTLTLQPDRTVEVRRGRRRHTRVPPGVLRHRQRAGPDPGRQPRLPVGTDPP